MRAAGENAGPEPGVDEAEDAGRGNRQRAQGDRARESEGRERDARERSLGDETEEARARVEEREEGEELAAVLERGGRGGLEHVIEQGLGQGADPHHQAQQAQVGHAPQRGQGGGGLPGARRGGGGDRRPPEPEEEEDGGHSQKRRHQEKGGDGQETGGRPGQDPARDSAGGRTQPDSPHHVRAVQGSNRSFTPDQKAEASVPPKMAR